ncbi:MAG TPA: RNA polymerase sigma factor, partial [Gemmataceae bacterium]|nr:RNA polymerase sigma factor [Gemmataceae bacterium]
DDAFQAAFLVLVRKARTVRPRLLGPWLYGVAYRTAMKAKSTAARRRAREAPLPDELCAGETGEDREELAGRLDREIQKLPERYRAAVVLCELQGLSYREAASRLGVKEGTLAGRLSRARRLLARRLRLRAVGVAAVPLVGAVVADSLTASVPRALLRSTVQAASGGRVSAPVAALTHGVMTNMLLTKLRPASAILVIGAMIVFAATGYRGEAAPEKPGAGKPAPPTADAEKPIDETLADPILFHPRVWLELKLSAEQRDEIDRLLDKQETDATEFMKEAVRTIRAGGNQQAAAEASVRAQNRIAQLSKQTAVAIQTKVLKPDQAKRMRQITLQAKGPDAFLRHDVRAALKYTSEQEKALSDQVESGWNKIRIGGDQSASEAFAAACSSFFEDFTKDQRKAWEELTGKSFQMPEIVVRKVLNQHALAAGPVFAPPGGVIPPLPAAPGGPAPAAPPPPKQ